MGLAAAIAEAQTLIKALDGIKGAPATMPDKLHSFPFSVAYPGAGRWGREYMGEQAQNVGDLVIELYLCPTDAGVEFAVTRLMDYFEDIPKALMGDETLDSNLTVQGMGPPTLTYDGLMMGLYAGAEVFFFRWRLSYEREEDL